MERPQQPQIQVELDEKAAEGIYSNFVLTAHNASEFVLDFARLVPGIPKAKVHARIIMTPQSAKALNLSLSDAISKYEGSFGKINIQPQRTSSTGVVGFQPNIDEESEKKKH